VRNDGTETDSTQAYGAVVGLQFSHRMRSSENGSRPDSLMLFDGEEVDVANPIANNEKGIRRAHYAAGHGGFSVNVERHSPVCRFGMTAPVSRFEPG
jgi:hypothetical protein